MISEASKVKAKYRLGIVDKTKVSMDGNIRSAAVRCVLVTDKDNVGVIRVQRPVQRLSFIFLVEEQWDIVYMNFMLSAWFNEEHLQ